MCKCSESFENKFVQCFDQQEIAMYLTSNGVIKLVHGDVVEMTNINFCPYCGRFLRKSEIKVDWNKEHIDPEILTLNTKIKPLVPDEPTEIQKAIKKALDESIFKNLVMGIPIEDSGFSTGMQMNMRGDTK